MAASVVRFVLVFSILIAPWPGLGRAFTDAVGAAATAVADPLSASSNVTFRLRSPTPAERLPDWRGVIAVRQDTPDGPVNHAGAVDLRRAGYLQLVAFAALTAAWPPRGRARALRAVCAAVVVVAMTVSVPVVDFLVPIGAIHLWGWLATAVRLAARALVAAPGMAYAVPGLTWLAVVESGGLLHEWPFAAAPTSAPGSGRL